jgi:hypothetical protein
VNLNSLPKVRWIDYALYLKQGHRALDECLRDWLSQYQADPKFQNLMKFRKNGTVRDIVDTVYREVFNPSL